MSILRGKAIPATPKQQAQWSKMSEKPYSITPGQIMTLSNLGVKGELKHLSAREASDAIGSIYRGSENRTVRSKHISIEDWRNGVRQ